MPSAKVIALMHLLAICYKFCTILLKHQDLIYFYSSFLLKQPHWPSLSTFNTK